MHQQFSVCIYHRTCGAIFSRSIRALTPASQSQTLCMCPLPVTSCYDILQTHGIQRPAMHTNNSAFVSTIGHVVIFFRVASGCQPQSLKVRHFVCQSLPTSSDFLQQYLTNTWDSDPDNEHKQFSMGFYHRKCGAIF